jgi:response regulator RpfG family c-di-GMP phosphodiesterase
MNMLISTNIASIGLIKRMEDADRAEDKAHTEDIVQGIHTTEKDTREVIREIKHSDRRSATSVISQVAGRQSILPRNARKLIRSSVNKRRTQQSKILLLSSTAASSPSTKDLKELTILLLPPNPRPSSLCQSAWKRPCMKLT